jgi:hypothetical protein
MTVVKGSKQYNMVVVPYRPWYRMGVVCLVLAVMTGSSLFAYWYGMGKGLATRVEVVRERDQIKHQLDESLHLIKDQRQQIADLKVGNQVDAKANEEVRRTVETQQNKIAELNEEIGFYKAVMLPNADEKGLRIERLDVKHTGQPGKYHFSLLLTQIVDKHNYIEGGVQIKLLGTENDTETSIPLAQLGDGPGSGNANNIKFRFRYFQNIEGDLTIPDGFQPKEFMVVAQASGRGGQRLEKKFEWHTGEG